MVPGPRRGRRILLSPRILCCSSVSFGKEAFSSLGETRVLDATAITRDELTETDILIVRSTTRVNRSLLEGTPVRFVGTATAGVDHLDIPYLESNHIQWTSAPGSNANSVAEYIMAVLLFLHRRNGLSLEKRTIGIIGVGNVGRRVSSLAPALGLKVLLCDPPLAEQLGRNQKTHSFVEQSALVAASDIISLHVPLFADGPYPTHHMVNEPFLRSMKRGATLINAARGPVVDAEALRNAYRDGYAPAHLVLDTWEPEPAFPWDILERADLATPHIAGYSIDGKVAGTFQVLKQLCRFLEKPVPDITHVQLPAPSVPEMVVTRNYHNELDAMSRVVPLIHGIQETDRRLRGLPGPQREDSQARATHFREQRKTYPKRREFAGTTLRVPASSAHLISRLRTLGFSVNPFS